MRNSMLKGARLAMTRALGEALAGGALRLYAGARGGEATLLSVHEFPEQFSADAEGVLGFGQFRVAKALAMGDASWFLAFGRAANAPLLEGSVGPGGDMDMERPRVYAGMELTLEGFEYRLRFEE